MGFVDAHENIGIIIERSDDPRWSEIFQRVKSANAGDPIREIVSSVAMPGLGTGVGRVPPIQCARQVRAAIEDIILEKYTAPTMRCTRSPACAWF